MKRKDYTRQLGASSRTAWRWWKAGQRPGRQKEASTTLPTPEASSPSAHAAQPRSGIWVFGRAARTPDQGEQLSKGEADEGGGARRPHRARRRTAHPERVLRRRPDPDIPKGGPGAPPQR